MVNKLIAVVGLGYVGLPLAALLSEHYHVIGFDTNKERIERIQQGESVISEPGLQEILSPALESGRMTVTSRPDKMADAHLKVITVGTPYDELTTSVDYTQLESAISIVSEFLKEGDVVLLKSTVPPGTTNGFVKDRIEAAGLRVPDHVGLVFSPERIVEGQAINDFRTLPKIIGATDERSFAVVKEIMEHIGGKIIGVSSPDTAEAVKMVDNYARFVFLGLTNEIALASERLGVDALEVIAAAKDHYPRNAGILIPGPGVGGSCLNKDPFILRAQLERKGLSMEMVKAAREVNYGMPFHVVDLVKQYANGRKQVTILGVAFKKDTDDTRYTPTTQIAIGLAESGFTVKCHDPYVHEYQDLVIEHSVSEAVKDSQILLVLTDHSVYKEVDLASLPLDNRQKPLIIDTRGILDRTEMDAKGFEYHGLGRL